LFFLNRPFEHLILVCIILNCVALGANKPYPNKDNDSTNELLVSIKPEFKHLSPLYVSLFSFKKIFIKETVEYFFLTIFTFECTTKIIAYGLFFHPGAYLRNYWNILDFCVVIIGLVSTANDLFASPDSEMLDLKSLRAARVVRPLKLVNGVPSRLQLTN